MAGEVVVVDERRRLQPYGPRAGRDERLAVAADLLAGEPDDLPHD